MTAKSEYRKAYRTFRETKGSAVLRADKPINIRTKLLSLCANGTHGPVMRLCQDVARPGSKIAQHQPCLHQAFCSHFLPLQYRILAS